MGGVEGAAFGVLIFVMGTLMAVNVWAVVDAKLATSAAAREATRAYVEAPDASAAAEVAGAAARRTVDGHGIHADSVVFDTPAWSRCGRVDASVSVTVPLVSLPLIGGGGGTRTVTSTHGEVTVPIAVACPAALPATPEPPRIWIDPCRPCTLVRCALFTLPPMSTTGASAGSC